WRARWPPFCLWGVLFWFVPRPAPSPDLAISDKIVAEGAGALAFAAREQLAPGPTTAVIISGGNIAPQLLAAVLTE
ncbi:MAG: hypothetical protein ACTHMJ_12165, partial [Thermomicrobiales bacterium]